MIISVQLDAAHPTVEALERLVPEAIVSGGSFAADLDHPNKILPVERRPAFEAARVTAIDQCIHRIFSRAGLPDTVGFRKGEGGDPLWPDGFVGSLSHKGTVVLAAMAPTSVVRALGIDVERIDLSDLGPIAHNIAPEGLPPYTEQSVGILLTLSAKEAVFKAQYPLTRQLLDFSDVVLNWACCTPDAFVAKARCDNAMVFEVRCTVANVWVLTAAVAS